MSRKAMHELLDEYVTEFRDQVRRLRTAADNADVALRAIIQDADDDVLLYEAFDDASKACRWGRGVLERIGGAHLGYAAACEKEATP